MPFLIANTVLTASSKIEAASTRITIKLPTAVESNQQDSATDFIETGAWEYANSTPGMVNISSPRVKRTY